LAHENTQPFSIQISEWPALVDTSSNQIDAPTSPVTQIVAYKLFVTIASQRRPLIQDLLIIEGSPDSGNAPIPNDHSDISFSQLIHA
jgi:hypothetical protein